MKKQAGFTMIELIIVIVILGILAATALPRFIDFSDKASAAALQGVVGGIASASAVNYAGKALGKTVTPASLVGSEAVVCTTAQLGGLLTTGWPTNGGTYAIGTLGATTCVSGGSLSCPVTFTPTGGTLVSATAVVTCY